MIKSLLHFNNPDDLTKDEVGVSWQVKGTVASSQDGKFGNCLSLARNNYLQNNTIDLSLDKEWTLDMWVYLPINDSYSSDICFFSIKSEGGNQPRLGIFVDYDALNLAIKSPNSFAQYRLGLPVKAWFHFALVNTSSLLYAFVNGVKKAEHNSKAINLVNSPEVLIGKDRRGNGFTGLIDEFRISNKALWTSDFTPPATESEYHQAPKYIYIDKNNTVMGMKE